MILAGLHSVCKVTDAWLERDFDKFKTLENEDLNSVASVESGREASSFFTEEEIREGLVIEDSVE